MDEKQLQMLWDLHAKNGGFKSFDEFKGLMSDSNARKVYFDNANPDLGFANYQEFENTLGVKKKVSPLPSGVVGPETQEQVLAHGFDQPQIGSTQPEINIQTPEIVQPTPEKEENPLLTADQQTALDAVETPSKRSRFPFSQSVKSVIEDMVPQAIEATQISQVPFGNTSKVYWSVPDEVRQMHDFDTDEKRNARVEEAYRKQVGEEQFNKEKKAHEQKQLIKSLHAWEEMQRQAKEMAAKKEGIPETFGKIKNAGGLYDWTMASIGEAVGQMPLALATLGQSSYLLERTGILMDGIQAKADAKKVTPEQLITSGDYKDIEDLSHEYGKVNAMLEFASLGTMVGALARKSFLGSLIKNKAAQQFLKSVPIKMLETGSAEGMTEFAQEVSSIVAKKIAANPSLTSSEAISQFNEEDWAQAWESAKRGTVGGAALGGGGSLVQNQARATKLNDIKQSRKEQQVNEKPKEPTVEPTGEGGQGTTEVAKEEALPVQAKTEEQTIETKNTTENEKVTTDTVPSGKEQENSGIKQEDAEAITRSVQDASPTVKGSQRSAREIKKEQDEKLETYAKERGAFIEDVKDKLGEKIAGGTEQDVYLSKEGNKVIKVNGLANNSSWSEFWDRLNLQKELFPNEAYKLIGFAKVGGRLSAVSEQPLIEGKPVPRHELIKDLFDKGFYQVHPDGTAGQNIFYNPELGIRISDVHGENVIKDANGDIRYIDPMLDRENPFTDKADEQSWIEGTKKRFEAIKETFTPKEGWQNHLIKAREYANHIGIETKGKDLKSLVSEIEYNQKVESVDKQELPEGTDDVIVEVPTTTGKTVSMTAKEAHKEAITTHSRLKKLIDCLGKN